MRKDLTVGSVTGMMTATGTMHPVVQTPAKTVDSQLLIAFEKAREQCFANIGCPIVVCVFRVDDLRGRRDQHSLTPRHDASWKRNILKQHRGCLILAIAIFIFQISNSPTRLAVVVHARRIISHLRNPQLPIGAPVDCNRVNDEWFCNNQLKLKALTNMSNFHGLRR